MSICSQCGQPLEAVARFCVMCGAPVLSSSEAQRDPLLGRVIGGSYVLEELLGLGGMGRVYRAEQRTLSRTVAVKVIHPHLLSDNQTVMRFYNEARAASRLNHPNSVSIIDFGRSDDGMLYLVMEHIVGVDLARVLGEQGPLPFRRALEILMGVLSALGEAHALGVVHRDLKPENVILKRLRTGADLVKVVDFGLATITTGAIATNVTTPGLVCGTPDYMSPEQARGEKVDNRTDLYAVGVMLFEMLADRLPYMDDTPTKLVMRHIYDPIPDPREMAPHRGIPQWLAELSMHSMAKNPVERFQTAEDMQLALKQAHDRLIAEPLAWVEDSAPEPATRPFTVPPNMVLLDAFVGREVEMNQLWTLRDRLNEGSRWVRIVGDPGVGKSRLLRELEAKFADVGDTVAHGSPHPTGAPLPYFTLRMLVAKLLGVTEQQLRHDPNVRGILKTEIEKKGFEEILTPTGYASIKGMRARTQAVSVMLMRFITHVLTVMKSERALIAVDDIDRCDGPSRRVITEFAKTLRDAPVLLVTVGTYQAGTSSNTSDRELIVPLKGLFLGHVAHLLPEQFLEAPRTKKMSSGQIMPMISPLYVEQVQRLVQEIGVIDEIPERLADIILFRLARLGMPERRLLQAICVLGERCSREKLMQAVPDLDETVLATLVARGWVMRSGEYIDVRHGYVRDLVEASVPSAVRKSLHDRAFDLARTRDEPLEIRAYHAWQGSQVFGALLLAERVGGQAFDRGDFETAMLFLRRGLETARRELLDRGDDTMDSAIVTFSRKLGDALFAMGDLSGADGVLRESVDLASAATLERSRMFLTLGAVATRRERYPEALRLLEQAMALASSLEGITEEGLGHLLMARIRRAQQDAVQAIGHYRRAIELLGVHPEASVSWLEALVEYAEFLVDRGNLNGATDELQKAEKFALEHNRLALASVARGTMASVHELRGEAENAVNRYQQAAILASQDGDVENQERWNKAAQALGRQLAQAHDQVHDR